MALFKKYFISTRIKTIDNNSYICISNSGLEKDEFGLFWCDNNMNVLGIASIAQWLEATTWGTNIEQGNFLAITTFPAKSIDRDLCKISTVRFSNYDEDKNQDSWSYVFDAYNLDKYTQKEYLHNGD